MELTLGQIVAAKSAIEHLLGLDPAPIARVAYVIVRNARAMEQYVIDYEKARQTLFKLFGEENEEDKIITIKKENLEKFKEEMRTLSETKVDIPIQAITEKDLIECEEKRDGFSVPTSILYTAWFIFNDDHDQCDP